MHESTKEHISLRPSLGNETVNLKNPVYCDEIQTCKVSMSTFHPPHLLIIIFFRNVIIIIIIFYYYYFLLA